MCQTVHPNPNPCPERLSDEKRVKNNSREPIAQPKKNRAADGALTRQPQQPGFPCRGSAAFRPYLTIGLAFRCVLSVMVGFMVSTVNIHSA
jgi:hypothetical protein